MNKVGFFIFLIFVSQLAFAEIALYTTESQNPHELGSMNDILERFTRESPEKNILFYVHGRNYNVEKEWDKIKLMEDAYHVKVVMLHWDAWSSLLSRAVKNAETSAGPLAFLFGRIKDFKESHKEFFINHKISLLCHSMGNLVLKNFTEKFLESENYNSHEPLFENYIGVGADVPLTNHRLWLSRFNLAKNKMILMNNRDIVLLLSYTLDLKDKNPFQYRLGLGLDNYPGKKDQIKEKLVGDVSYIDLSGALKAEHSYFLPKTPLMQVIFSRLTNGYKFELNSEEKNHLNVKLKIENNIFYVKENLLRLPALAP